MNLSLLFHWRSARLDTRTIAGLSMLCALYVVLNMFVINVSATLQIKFSFIALALSCALYGFWPNMIFSVVVDFLGWCVNPTGPYVPFFAVAIMIKALIYSLFFYQKKKITIWAILGAVFLSSLISNVLINTILLHFMYAMDYRVLLASRLIKNAAIYPIDCGLLYLALRLLQNLPFYGRLKPDVR